VYARRNRVTDAHGRQRIEAGCRISNTII